MIAAIDPGITGAICIHDEGRYTFFDMPVLSTRNGKKRVDGQSLAAILKGCTHVAIEEVSAMPGQGVTSMFGFGYSAGVCAGVCGALGASVHMVSPRSWKAHHSGLIGSDKDYARTMAIQRYPELAEHLQRKKDIGRADALWLCLWLQSQMKKD
jgi:crossover junction endodeoxyribonuclease RuvC